MTTKKQKRKVSRAIDSGSHRHSSLSGFFFFHHLIGRFEHSWSTKRSQLWASFASHADRELKEVMDFADRVNSPSLAAFSGASDMESR